MSLPRDHLLENQKLNSDAYVDLFEIKLTDGTRLYLKNNGAVSYRNVDYQAWAVQLSGVGSKADEEETRPTLVMANRTDDLQGVFSTFVEKGVVDRAIVVRRRVLLRHLKANVDVSQTRTWFVARVTNLNLSVITLELRSFGDGANHFLPARMYIPPEFPTVSLK